MIIERTYVSPSGDVSERPLYLAGPSGSFDIQEVFINELKINPGYEITFKWGGKVLSNSKPQGGDDAWDVIY